MRKFVLAMTALLLSTATASAAVTEFSIQQDVSNKRIVISGKALPNENVSIQVLPENVSLSEFAQSSSKSDIIEFVYEKEADAKGNFVVSAGLEDSGDYKVYVASSDVSVSATSKEFTFYPADLYKQKIELVNNAKTESGENGFVNAAKDVANISVLGFDEKINDIIPVEETLTLIYKELGQESLKENEYLKNVYLYRNCFVVLALNKGVLTDIDTYVQNILDEDATLKAYWERYVTNSEVKKYLINKISKKSISSVSKLKEKMKEGLVLAATKYPNGYMTLKDLYTDYKDTIGLTNISSSNSVYKEVGGNDYATVADLKKAYEKAVKGSNDNSSSSVGGGGSSGGGNTISNESLIGNIVVDSGANSNSNPNSIGLKFLDLSAFEWAYPSISSLYDKGIVSGVSEEQFAPARQVKREEFVKMIVSALNLNLETGSFFGDVDSSAWYAPYVYAAYNNKIINGISADAFGVSKNITRQDMAVIIYNAIKSKGYEKVDYEINFSDKEAIADYAREAVEQLVALEIISGTDDNRFAPTEDATRAQAAVILERALKCLN